MSSLALLSGLSHNLDISRECLFAPFDRGRLSGLFLIYVQINPNQAQECHTSKVRFVFSSGCNKDLQFLLRRFLCHANIYVCEI